MPDIRVQDARLAFQNRLTGTSEQALDGVSLTVGHGEFVSLIGPSGCGKTTLINAIAGFLRLDSGQISVEDQPVDGVLADKVAFMLARDALLPWRTALRNVELALELDPRQRATRPDAHELLELVGLRGFEDFYPNQLSQGMRQRVAIARTLAADRDVLLMDEPFAALDAQTRTVIGSEFVRLWEQRRKTVVFVTHDLTEAIALADRVIVMTPRPGRIRAEHAIDLPRPRVVIDLPSQPAFHDLHRMLWDELKEGIADTEGLERAS